MNICGCLSKRSAVSFSCALLIGLSVLAFGERALAADPCSLFEALGVDCEYEEIALFQRTHGSTRYVRSSPRALNANHQTFACCASGVPASSLFLVRAYDLELVPEEEAALPDNELACGIPLIPGIEELRSYLGDEEAAAGLLSFQASEGSTTRTLVEIRGHLDTPNEGRLDSGLCNMAGDTPLWTDPFPSAAIKDDAAFAGWERIGKAVLVHLEVEEVGD